MKELRRDRNSARIAMLIVVSGVIARLALVSVSWGTADADTWLGFAQKIASHGIVALYQSDANFNHPPLPGYFAALAYLGARATGLMFPLLFKLPSIIADALTCCILWRMHRRAGRWLAVGFAWNFNSILVSAHHCNTDSIYAMLCLAGVWLICRGRHLAGGLTLGAAVNIKLIPVVVIIPMLLLYRDRRTFFRFVLGLSIAEIPFIMVLILVGRNFALHALAYTSFVDNWGAEFFIQWLARSPRLSVIFGPMIEGYQSAGRWIVLAAVLWMSLVARRRRIDRFTAGALAAAIFLIVTPGFGIQYTAFVSPLLFAAAPFHAALYATFSGLMAVCWYGLNWNGRFPITNPPGIQLRPPTSWLGLCAWLALVGFVAASFISRSRSAQDESP